MKSSNIGGQAVIEGIMMRNGDKYSVAVRRDTGEIEVIEKEYQSIIKNKKLLKTPFVRGVFAFIDSLVLGISTLTLSAEFFADDEEEQARRSKMTVEELEKEAQKDKAIMSGTVVVSVIIALGIFVLLPYFLSRILHNVMHSEALIALIEGVIRLGIFIAYVALISLMKDIKRVYMYHGAEHKCINCIEHGLPLTVENVRKSSKEHKRCGTSFLLFVVLISILIFMVIRVDSGILRIVLRLLMIPVIASLSYELLKFTGRKDNAFTNIISRPGMWVQGLTTKEPDDDMIEVGIASVEKVFDWKKWQEENL